MNLQKFGEIVDKHVDQQAIAKDLAMEIVMPWLDGIKAKIESGEIDPVKGTDLDKVAMLASIEGLKKLAAV